MFNNRVVFVAGASGNLGFAVSNVFLAKGATLVLMDRTIDKLMAAFPALVGSDKHLLLPCVDMANPEIFGECVAQTLERFGRIDVFISIVGGYRAGTPLHETPVDTFDFLMTLNARTLYVAAQAVIPDMIEKGYGKIVAVGARPGIEGKRNMAAYSASKSATLRLVESMSAELKNYGINVNAVVPGTMDTPQNREATPEANFDRWVSVESVAEVIAFLASDSASNLHGVSVPVYGLT